MRDVLVIVAVDLIVNATGPDYALRRGAVPLLNSLRADHWEATAATELRDHAERLAAHFADRRV